jgi:hypothetical protein
MSVAQGIQKIAGTFGLDNVYMLTCEVSKVDVSDRSCMCAPVNGNMADFKAYLMAETDDGVLILPTVGSTVKVLFSNQNAPTVIQYSEIDKLLIISGNQSYSIADGSQVFNDGSFGGLVKVIELTTKLNNLENLVNSLINKFNSHTHILALTAGTGTAAPTAAPETTVLTPTQKTDIENSEVTHGKG